MIAVDNMVKVKAAVTNANTAMREAASTVLQQRTRITELQSCLNRMVLAHENTSSDSEGRWPQPDSGCIECTVGTVPDRLNTGLCAYHEAKRLLGQS